MLRASIKKMAVVTQAEFLKMDESKFNAIRACVLRDQVPSSALTDSLDREHFWVESSVTQMKDCYLKVKDCIEERIKEIRAERR